MSDGLAASLEPVFARIRNQKVAAVNELIRWCDQNSWSLDVVALREMATMLVDDFGAAGIRLERTDLPELKLLDDTEAWRRQPTGPLLQWHHNPNARRRVLLMIHYDTVYPASAGPNRCVRSSMRMNPSGGEVDSPIDALIGPGTADAKGGIAVIKLATEAILSSGLVNDIGISIVLNPDEEIGTTASGETLRAMAGSYEQALVFEPTLPDGSLVANRKGSGNFVFVVRGRSAHAGRNPEQGRNAIVHLASLIPDLTQMHDPTAGVTVNVGRIVGGGPLNQVPDHAAVQLNIRVNDQAARHRAEHALADIARRFCRDEYQVTLQGEFHSPPKRVDGAIQRVQRAVERAAAFSGRTVRWADTGGACDGSKLADWGLPNVDTMGVAGGGLHSPDEFCDLDAIVPAAATVAAFLAGFAEDDSTGDPVGG
ncbi:Carboxypeptidase G2 precursor [Rubripirellula tenax]|uniref:Carboxypeptidase G2 n=1 Tax=Rubripirellula tenax TaxID=2528015 RepID=A0A5C6FB75_9BACT|nr:hydrolase [Rubripirellula tenax]TWU56829.1 Carboxypeptidase G2 precursor [Rubripirellula tenax]